MLGPDLAAETLPPASDPVTQTSSGGDFMVDSAAADIYAYVRSLPGPTSPDANSLLRQ